MSTDPLCLVFVPALVSLLKAAEDRKGSQLSEDEVLEIRDNATATAIPFSVAVALEKERGYEDIVPEECWKEWQRVRSFL
ncbi:hypothetical protein DA83_01690 [Pseudomonas sp. 250J]|uniref:Uncharacterized protein n=2 Tax=Pseudomonas TaxID=286 RepID=A0AA42RSD0_9PSED|nr:MULTISPECIES: hypothetical protein [Pseudomonas]KNX77383.1 hypothetical protein DA83_01690 [Pseudomonas sp. 250J]MCU7239033.1 hypothetical protein [Pseudomonas peradeniyensis]MCU7280785.1 hypothetical protein [Pseudomonas peradeniyensis]MDH1629199.1 hypothetical protein [Pseudomonas mosselii]QZA56528.1 hypothetical protein K2O50_10990 [Pseudomonas sp. 2hn]